jgi:hypothetical protein
LAFFGCLARPRFWHVFDLLVRPRDLEDQKPCLGSVDGHYVHSATSFGCLGRPGAFGLQPRAAWDALPSVRFVGFLGGPLAYDCGRRLEDQFA